MRPDIVVSNKKIGQRGTPIWTAHNAVEKRQYPVRVKLWVVEMFTTLEYALKLTQGSDTMLNGFMGRPKWGKYPTLLRQVGRNAQGVS